MTKESIILAIESSCDDTSAAVIKGQKILSNEIANQEIHSLYGGVVPELASRAHQQNIIPVVDLAIKKAKIKKENISAIAFTQGPGLLGSLLVGSSFAKSFAMGMDIPIITVNHMQGHILAHFIDEGNEKPRFPFLCLTVSGGHTQIVEVKSTKKMNIIGTTLDDAAGEAFDKSAKILGLKYPGGPLIDEHAKKGNIHRFTFGKPKVKGLDFSFSGLKTSILYKIQKNIQKAFLCIYGIWGPSACRGSMRLVNFVFLLLARASRASQKADIVKQGFQNLHFQVFLGFGGQTKSYKIPIYSKYGLRYIPGMGSYIFPPLPGQPPRRSPPAS